MNPLTKVKLINELNEREVQLGVAEKVSWHSEYKDSAWIFLGGLPYELTEGDIICVFSHEAYTGTGWNSQEGTVLAHLFGLLQTRGNS
nr:RNA-binding motif protein, X-linked 2 [Globicephala melas]